MCLDTVKMFRPSRAPALSSPFSFNLKGSKKERTVLLSQLFSDPEESFSFSEVDQCIFIPLAPFYRLSCCRFCRLSLGSALRHRLAFLLLCRFLGCRLFGGLLLSGRQRLLPEEVLSADLHHVVLPRLHFVFVSDFVVLGQLRVDLTCETNGRKHDVKQRETALELNVRDDCEANLLLVAQQTPPVIKQ